MARTSAWLLTAVTAVTLGCAVAAIIIESRQTGSTIRTDVVMKGIAENISDVKRIEINYSQGGLILERDQLGNWSLPTKDGFAARNDVVNEFLVALGDLHYLEPKTQRAALHKRLGVEDVNEENSQSSLVTLYDSLGHQLGSILIGRPRSYAFGSRELATYVRFPDHPQAWLATGRVDPGKNFRDWINPNIIDLGAHLISSVTITYPDQSLMRVFRDQNDADFSVDGNFNVPSGMRYDQSEVNFVHTGLSYLDFDDVVSVNSFESGDFDHIVELGLFDGRVISAELANYEGRTWIRLRADGGGLGGQDWIKRFNSKTLPWVYLIPDYKARKLRGNFNDLLEENSSDLSN